MRRHETPRHVAEALAKWVKPSFKSFLDPAVGNGSLLEPVLKRIRKDSSHITAVDIDDDVFDALEVKLLGCRVKCISSDFFDVDFKRTKFDCILMNPPFNARSIDGGKASVPMQKGSPSLPIEAGFLKHALSLLAIGGRIIAILPSSVITGMRAMSLRSEVLSKFKVLCVHELPRSVFLGCEVKTYIVVIEKNVPSLSVTLCNHSLTDPESIECPIKSLGDEQRLDYSYHKAKQENRTAGPRTDGTKLSELAVITRGTKKSPRGKRTALHTSDFKGVSWRASRIVPKKGSRLVNRKTIIMSRVGRSAGNAVGIFSGRSNVDATDCLFAIQPKDGISRDVLLLSLRSWICSGRGKMLLQRGSCAKYVRGSDVADIPIPYSTIAARKKLLISYSRMVRLRDVSGMLMIEKRACKIIGGQR